MKAIVVGATGLIGKELVKQLLHREEFEQVVCLGRRFVDLAHPALEQKIVDLGDTSALGELVIGDVLFCALGTTIKTAGSQEKFRLVDHTYVVNAAKAASANGVGKFCVVSSIGAKAESKNFYLRTKGEMEEEVKKLPFESVHIFRPSLLLGKRNETRPGEIIGEVFFKIFRFLFIGKLKRYAAVYDSAVASAMINSALDVKTGVHFHESETIRD